jgi:arylsulfatase A-like enzyme
VSILCGQYAHNTKVTDNELPGGGFAKVYELGLEASMFPVWLQESGYHTAMFGKYLNLFPFADDRLYIPPGWSEWYSPADGDPYSEYNYTLNENGSLIAYGSDPDDYGADVYAAKTIRFIQESVEQDRPFFAFVSPYAPHKPNNPAPRHVGMFSDLELPRPPSFNEPDLRDKLDTFLWKPELKENDIERYEAQYRLRIESLQAVDEMVAGIVSTLETLKELENTYIFFTSDNGFHIGEHRLPPGKNTPYEEDIRVPFLAFGPGIRAGMHIEELAGNIDIASTIAELAGAEIPEFVDGRSLVPLLFNEPVDEWRQAYLLQRAKRPQADGASHDETAFGGPSGLIETPDSYYDAVPLMYVGLRTEQYTYVEFDTGKVHIYDLKNDPYQLENFAATADPALIEKLHLWLEKLKSCAGQSCRTIDGRPP